MLSSFYSKRQGYKTKNNSPRQITLFIILQILAKEAFKLIIENPVRTVVLNNMVSFLLFVGKMVIVAGFGTLSYLVFHGWFPEIAHDMPNLNFFFTPLVFITVGTYFIASSFFDVYTMAVDTIFLSLLQDLKQNDGSPDKPYIMEKSESQFRGLLL